MEPVRCRWFDDDGNPLRGGCRFGSKCHYIHPSDPIWSTTMRHPGKKGSGRHKDDWLPPPSPDSGYRRASNHHRQASGEHGSAWARSPTDNGRQSQDFTKNKHTGEWHNRSGSAGNSSTWNSTNDTSTGWGLPKNPNEPDTSSGGWGSAADNLSGDPGWGTASGWGSTEGWDSASGWGLTEGWGSTDGQGSPALGTSGWGESSSGEAKKQIRKSSGAEDFLKSNSASEAGSPTLRNRPTLSSLVISSTVANVNDRISSPRMAISPNSPSARSFFKFPQDVETKDTTQHSSSSTAPTIKIPLPARMRPPLPTRIKRTSQSVDTTEKNLALPQDWTTVPLSGSVTSHISQEDIVSDVSGPTSKMATGTPKDLYETLIKEVFNAVSIRYRLLKAEEKKSNWRSTRASACYVYSTPAAQKRLDAINQQYSEDIVKLTKQLNTSLRQIVRHSDALNDFRDLVKKGIDPQKLVLYTVELRDWIKDLDLPKRLLMAKELDQREKEEKKAFRMRRQEEVDSLKASLLELEQKATDISDEFFHLQFIHSNGIEEEFKATKKALNEDSAHDTLDLEKLFGNLGVWRDTMQEIKKNAKAMDEDFERQLPKIVELIEKANALEQQVEDLRQKNKEIQEFRQGGQAKLERRAQWEREDQAKLDELSNQIENLHKLPRRQPQIVSPPIKAEDLTPYINRFVQEYVAEEIKPVLDTIAESCEANHRLVKTDFDKLLAQVLEKTYEVCQISLKEAGLEARIVSQQPPPS